MLCDRGQGRDTGTAKTTKTNGVTHMSTHMTIVPPRYSWLGRIFVLVRFRNVRLLFVSICNHQMTSIQIDNKINPIEKLTVDQIVQ